MTPVPVPAAMNDPSNYIVQYTRLARSGGIYTSVHSVMKSVRTCDLIAILGMYLLWQPMSSVAHFAMQP